jgi:excisionase family DNA binding protein
VSFTFYLCPCFPIGNATPIQRGATGQRRGWELQHTPDSPNLKIKNMGEELKKVADLVTANTIFCTKEVLTSDEAAKYMGVSKSYIYKLTMRQAIPHYKPMGKMCYFKRAESEDWLQSNRVATAAEISQQAQSYCMKKGGRV